MQRTLLALALGIACAGAAAADAPEPQPLAGGAIAAAKAQGRPLVTLAPAPSVMQTSAVVQPDGTVALVCSQVRNPHPQPITINRPAPVPQQ